MAVASGSPGRVSHGGRRAGGGVLSAARTTRRRVVRAPRSRPMIRQARLGTLRPTRRDLLRAATLGGAALAVPPAYFPSRRKPAGRPVDPRGTTLDSTVLRSAS